MNLEKKSNLAYEVINFKWKYSDEKTLFLVKENLVYFIFSKLFTIIPILIFTSIVSWILYYFNNLLLSIITTIIVVLLILWYYTLIFKDSFLIFTTRRVIKQIRTSLFSYHRKELKVLDIKSSMHNKKWFIQTILWIWNIKVEWSEKEWNIYFTWIKEHSAISNYIWRVIDYIKIEWHTDNIAMYQNKKIRKEKKRNN